LRDIYTEDYKTLKKKEVKQDMNKWKDIPYSWMGKLSIVKMFILSKAIYSFNAATIKIPMALSY
jgi:hypothetical protein